MSNLNTLTIVSAIHPSQKLNLNTISHGKILKHIILTAQYDMFYFLIL